MTRLGRASNIYQTDELYIFDKPDWIAERHPGLQENWDKNFHRGYPAHFEHESRLVFPYEKSAPRLAEFNGTYAEFCVSYMNEKASENGCGRWIEKTPTNIFSLPLLSERLPDLRYIIIVRHPGAVLRSLSKRKFNPFIAAARAYYPMLVAANISERDNVHVLRYEDLTANPAGTLKQAFDFIGEPFDQDYLVHGGAAGEPYVPSWQFNPSMKIVERDDTQPAIGAEHAFHTARFNANAYFLDYVGIERSFSFLQLCEVFGYDVTLDPTTALSIKPRLKRIDAYAKYVARSVQARRPIRKKWQ